MFALGILAGAIFGPTPATRTIASAPATAPRANAVTEISRTGIQRSDVRLDPALVYPADVLRVIDGDTFAARVRVWPGLDVETHVRLRGIDAPELHARCAGELAKAQAARAALETILADGDVTVSRVGVDKYGGRVDAAVATRNTADVSAALLGGGFARSYDGGRRGSWC